MFEEIFWDENDAIEYIYTSLRGQLDRDIIYDVLSAEANYMSSIGLMVESDSIKLKHRINELAIAFVRLIKAIFRFKKLETESR